MGVIGHLVLAGEEVEGGRVELEELCPARLDRRHLRDQRDVGLIRERGWMVISLVRWQRDQRDGM